MPTEQKQKLILIDASGYIHRAYHALPPLTTSKGLPVNAIYGFSRMLLKAVKSENPDYVGVCFDTAAPTFRHEMYTDYKGTRKETDDALILQLPLALEFAQKSGFPCILKEGYEADDVIATLALRGVKNGWDVLIFSGDKDILQLVGNNIRVRDDIRRVDYDDVKVIERFSLRPNQLVDYFSLMGDKVDNVIGVPGVGEKTAAKLLLETGTLESLYERIDRGELPTIKESLKEKLIANKENVFKNRKLVLLDTNVPVDNQLSLQMKNPSDDLSSLLQKLEFKGDIPVPTLSPVTESEVNVDRKVRLVLTQNDLNDLENALKEATRISYDLETDSLDVRSCHIIGFALSVKEHEGWYIPLGHSYLGVPSQLPWDLVRSIVGPYLTKADVLRCGQNIKFDNAILRNHGLIVEGPFFDTMIAAYCLDPARNSFGLKDLARDYLNEAMVRFEELIEDTKLKTIEEVDVEKASSYAAADAEVVFRLVDIFKERLSHEPVQNFFSQIEMPLVQIIESMERTGISLDKNHLKKVGDALTVEKEKIEALVMEMAGEKFLLTSPQQLARILFEKLKLPATKKNKTGYSTNEEVLSKLASEYPICGKVLEYRELSKLTSTYVDSLLEQVNYKTGRVHTSFHQTGTSTGRLSSTEPNLQNIPIRTAHGQDIRRSFVPKEGCVFLSADYSQIDLRALAHMSKDPMLIETFKSNGDVHTATAAQMFHVDPSQVTSEDRRRAKAINFGIVYGQQAWGLSQGLGIDLSEAKTFIEKYFERYSRVKQWMEETLLEARKNGYVATISGRKRRIEGLDSTNQSARGFAERIAINTPIQGTSADIIKMAMVNIDRALQQETLASKMILQVHDDLLFEVPTGELEKLVNIVKLGMENACQLVVPLAVSIKVGANWNDMAPIKEKVLA